MTNTKEVIEYINFLYKNNMEILINKNADYSGDDNEFFNNFLNVERLGITSVEKGLLVRITDKFTRINNLIDKEAKVKDEKIEDTIADFINYLAILGAYLKFKKGDKN